MSRQFQFSLRTLLIVILIAGIALGIHGSRSMRKRQAIATIERLGGRVEYDYKWRGYGTARQSYDDRADPPGPHWLRRALGDNYFAEPVEIQLFADPKMYPEQFGDHEAAQIAVLSELQWLVLTDTAITDAGLQQFGRLNKLSRLDLEGTRVTDAGVEELHRALPGCKIFH